MRASIVTGVLLGAAVVILVLLSAALDLEIESFVQAGALTGAVAALVPDRSLSARLLAVALGVFASWVGFVLRAAVLPDSTGGLAVAALVTVLICLLVAVISAGRLPFWGALLGAALLAGAYESAYSDAPSELLQTSVDAITALAITGVVGFLAVSIRALRRPSAVSGRLEEVAR
jgi:ABC-type transport system involved in cytochrome c biogenesis permease subunit